MFKYIVLILVLVSEISSRCTFQHYLAQCDSLGGLKQAGEQKEWTNILLKSFGTQERIESKIFKNVPEVARLEFENSANGVEDYAFASLSSLKEIRFESCYLPYIKKHSFSNSSIHFLKIHASKVTTFESKCFEGAQKLKHLQISHNNISRIAANVFSGTFIHFLYLENNSIRFIEDNAFANMTELLHLSLKGNLLTSFNSELIMGTEVTKLLILNLRKNKLENITENSFAMFPNIKFIYLKSNELEWIHDSAFNGLSQLEKLDLSGNKLKSFTEMALPFSGLPSLRILLLNKNHLTNIPRSFVRYFPKLQFISIFRNPLQCACYKDIINSFYHNNVKVVLPDEYLNGERPVCVVPRTSIDTCAENIPDANDLYETYNDALNKYEPTDLEIKFDEEQEERFRNIFGNLIKIDIFA